LNTLQKYKFNFFIMYNQSNGYGHSIYQMGFFSPLVSTGLQTYRGKVVDANTNTPLSAAHVYYFKNGNEIGVITNQNGEFVIEASPDDFIIISFMGFQTIEARASELRAIEYMHPEVEQLEEVNITNKKEEPKSNMMLYLGLGVLALMIGSSIGNMQKSESV